MDFGCSGFFANSWSWLIQHLRLCTIDRDLEFMNAFARACVCVYLVTTCERFFTNHVIKNRGFSALFEIQWKNKKSPVSRSGTSWMLDESVAEWANERTVERVAPCLRLDFWWFWTIVSCIRTTGGTKSTEMFIFPSFPSMLRILPFPNSWIMKTS